MGGYFCFPFSFPFIFFVIYICCIVMGFRRFSIIALSVWRWLASGFFFFFFYSWASKEGEGGR